jgi:galactan 5-O-arabinofuranosyltransferase
VKEFRKGDLFFLFGYIIITVGVTLVYNRVHVSSDILDLFVSRTSLLFCALLLVLLFLAKTPILVERRAWLSILILSFYVTTIFVFLFRNTDYGMNGVEGDEQFITASITKYANYWRLVDFSYHGLSAFYPPVYFYVMGKLAWLLHIEPYKITKWGPILVAFLGTLLIYLVWSRFVNRTFALLLTFVSVLIDPMFILYKPYEFIVLAMMIPWWLFFVSPKEDSFASKRKYVGFLLLGGWIGSLLFQTYYYWFFIFGVYTLIQMIVDFIKERSLQYLLQKYKHPFLVLGLTFIFSLFYLAPLGSDFMKYGIEPLQNRWFRLYMLDLPTYHLGNTVNIIYFIGFASLFWFSQKNELMKKLLILLGAAYTWKLLGHLGIAINKPLLHVKGNNLIQLILVAGFCYFIYFLSALKDQKVRWKPILLFALLYVFTSLGQDITQVLKNPLYEHAHEEKVVPEVAVLKKIDCKGKVFLSDNMKLSAYLPVFNFFNLNGPFSHHSSRRDERILFLQGLSQFHDPQFVAWMLTYNRYDKVDFVSLPHGEMKKVSIEDWSSPFPLSKKIIQITFDPQIFQSAYFKPIPGLQEMVEVQPIDIAVCKQFAAHQLQFARKYVSEERKESLN